MTQDRNATIAAALDKLFRTYEKSDRNADPGDLARERMAKAKVYFEAVDPYEAQDVNRAVSDFLSGDVPAGWNLAYPPSAPQVGSAVRRAMEARLDRENRARRLRPALPAPDVVKSPESRAKVAAMVAGVVSNLSASMLTEEAAQAKRRAELQTRVDDRFLPDDSPEAMQERLTKHRPIWTVGDRAEDVA